MHTISLPFGHDNGVLILCRNSDHRIEVIKAFGMPARYEVWDTAMMGHRFNKVIWLAGRSESQTEQQVMDDVQRMMLPCLLRPGGELHVL